MHEQRGQETAGQWKFGSRFFTRARRRSSGVDPVCVPRKKARRKSTQRQILQKSSDNRKNHKQEHEPPTTCRQFPFLEEIDQRQTITIAHGGPQYSENDTARSTCTRVTTRSPAPRPVTQSGSQTPIRDHVSGKANRYRRDARPRIGVAEHRVPPRIDAIRRINLLRHPERDDEASHTVQATHRDHQGHQKIRSTPQQAQHKQQGITLQPGRIQTPQHRGGERQTEGVGDIKAVSPTNSNTFRFPLLQQSDKTTKAANTAIDSLKILFLGPNHAHTDPLTHGVAGNTHEGANSSETLLHQYQN